MKKILVHIWLATVAVGVLIAAPVEPARVTGFFDANWRFLKADANGAEQPQFDDSAWRKLNLPHDWSIEGPFSETNRTGGSGGFLPSGVGWYRKDFSLPDTFSNQCVFVEFDGVMQNSKVWINGASLGKRPFGYVSFGCELTGHLNFGAGRTNVLAVRADTSEQPASRWYSGAGIYRHVRLVVIDPVHFGQWGNFVTTTPVATLTMRPGKKTPMAMVQVQSTVTNQSDAVRDLVVQFTALNPDGKSVAENQTALQTVAPGQSVVFKSGALVRNPQLWNLDNPKLYRAVCQIRDGKKVLDEQITPFGIREAKFDADTGFWLNGRNFKIKGVCLHHDGGAFGAAVPLGVREERLKTLKSLGVNAIRTAHNPPAPEFLDLCDHLGFLVMDEMFDCWTVAKNPYDYHLYFNEWSKTDERDTILRDQNHPGIILYSVGNEIHDTPKAEMAKGILQGLVEVAHEADPTRPVTQALFRPNVSHDYDDGLADMLDVVGQNYRENEILAAHEQKPSRKIIGRSNARMCEWIDNFVRRGTDFDIIGMSCYAQAQEGDWKTNFDDLATRYPDKGLLVVEYSARKRFINDLMFNTPNQKGLGTFIWEPTRHREALFDRDGKNAGGGQASNFTTDEGINQGARLTRTNSISATNLPAGATNATNVAANTNSPEFIYRRFGTNEAARAEWRKRRFGGRYDANELIDLYPQMSKDYGHDN